MSDNDKSIGDLTLMKQLQQAGIQSFRDDAAAKFYARYVQKLLSLVERNLAARFSARVDPEDIVQSVFRTWFRRTREGWITPSAKDDIWKLLSVVALCKVRNTVAFHDAFKRDVARTMSDEELAGYVPEPTKQEARDFQEIIELAAEQLDEMPRRTLDLILAGESVEDIARQLGRTTRSVTRYKDQIGQVLRGLLGIESPDAPHDLPADPRSDQS